MHTHASLSFTCPLRKALAVVGVNSIHAGASILAVVPRTVINVVLAVLASEAWGKETSGSTLFSAMGVNDLALQNTTERSLELALPRYRNRLGYLQQGAGAEICTSRLHPTLGSKRKPCQRPGVSGSTSAPS